MMTWYIGMATMVFMGIVKLLLSFAGPWIQRVVPQAGLLGSLAGAGLILVGYLPVVEIFGLPVVGMVALGIILYALVARIRLPKDFPGVFAAIIVGCALYYTLGPLGLAGGTYSAPSPELHFGIPIPTLDFLKGLVPALKYLPIAIPFGSGAGSDFGGAAGASPASTASGADASSDPSTSVASISRIDMGPPRTVERRKDTPISTGSDDTRCDGLVRRR